VEPPGKFPSPCKSARGMSGKRRARPTLSLPLLLALKVRPLPSPSASSSPLGQPERIVCLTMPIFFQVVTPTKIDRFERLPHIMPPTRPLFPSRGTFPQRVSFHHGLLNLFRTGLSDLAVFSLTHLRSRTSENSYPKTSTLRGTNIHIISTMILTPSSSAKSHVQALHLAL
jgi:hypothetical protein